MKRSIEISASFTGKINTGQFENESPFFSIKEIVEDIDSEDYEVTDEHIKIRQKELKEICYNQFKQHAEIAYQEKVAKAYKNIRFYDGKDGLKYPSTTSVINLDSNFFVSPEDLYQYSCRGTVYHKLIEIYLKTGNVVNPKDVPEIAFETMTVLTGSLGLSLEDINYVGFFKKYPVKIIEQEKVIINDEHRFGGRLDILFQIDSKNPGDWSKVEGIEFDKDIIGDFKTGQLDKLKGFMQQASYCKTLGVTQAVLIPFGTDTVQGFSKPVFTNKIDNYFGMFLTMRKKFYERFSV